MQYSIAGPILTCKNVSVSYDKKVILRDINFQINDIVASDRVQGQVVSLIGRSGIGKSVLFKSLSGMHKPTSGEVLLYDYLDVAADGPKAYIPRPVKAGEVGIVTQNYLLFNHRTVRSNLEVATNDMFLLNSYAVEFNLIEHMDKYPHQLSGGQRQRTSIVQQILTGNNLILLDEPFSGLDCLMVNKVLDMLSRVATKNETITLVIVSHNLVNALSISDNVFVMAKEEGLEGATIIKHYDLLAEDLCYHPDIRERKRFKDIIREIEGII